MCAFAIGGRMHKNKRTDRFVRPLNYFSYILFMSTQIVAALLIYLNAFYR